MSRQSLKGSGGKLGPLAPMIESVFELAQWRCDPGRQSRHPTPSWLSASPPELGARRELGHAGSEDTAVDSGKEQGRAEAEGGQLVAMGSGDGADESVQA